MDHDGGDGVRTSAGRERRGQRGRRRSLTCAAVTSFAVKFLGCKVSQADAMLARHALLAAGHEEVPEDEAELHVINTCCITCEAEAKSRQSAGARSGTPSACSSPAAR